MADTWKIISQRETPDITPDGRFQSVMEVVVEAISGTVITVRIPVDQYSAAVAEQMIDARVTDVLAVEAL